MEKINQIIQENNQLKQEYIKQQNILSEKFSVAFKELLSMLFEEIQSLESISWKQFTPYFNDGDALIFTIIEPDFKFSDSSQLTQKQDKLLDEFVHIVDEQSDFMLNSFGDHQKIKVTKEGIEQQYYHEHH